MSDNPLSQDQIDALKKSSEELTKVDGRIAKMKQAGIPVDPTLETQHKDLKERVSKLLLVYGKK